ncbi:hypothetical protein Tco_0954963 [Tanacetum coccineum]|uniref:Uncharacterized protein n=1 Tax=Tanacetum coccineum TaxID=301880 RepID=A0ABQ5E5U2_9ASTR
MVGHYELALQNLRYTSSVYESPKQSVDVDLLLLQTVGGTRDVINEKQCNSKLVKVLRGKDTVHTKSINTAGALVLSEGDNQEFVVAITSRKAVLEISALSPEADVNQIADRNLRKIFGPLQLVKQIV